MFGFDAITTKEIIDYSLNKRQVTNENCTIVTTESGKGACLNNIEATGAYFDASDFNVQQGLTIFTVLYGADYETDWRVLTMKGEYPLYLLNHDYICRYDRDVPALKLYLTDGSAKTVTAARVVYNELAAIAFTYENDTISTWKNGELIERKASVTPKSTTYNNIYLLSSSGDSDNYNNKVLLLAIYNKALTDEQIKSLFRTTKFMWF